MMERREDVSKEKERFRDLADAIKGNTQARPMMFLVAKPDKFLDRPGEPAINFETWMGLFESYMDVCLLQGADDTSIMAVFKISLGTEEYNILRRKLKQSGTLDEMIQSMKEYYNP